MSPTEAIVLGIVQGLTEFLPISSTAHLRVVPALLHWADPGAAYTAVIQLGSILAVLAYFARDLIRMTIGSLQAIQRHDYASQDVRILGAILVGTLPIGVLGLLLKHLIEQPDSPMRSLSVIGFASIFMAVMLFLAERFGSQRRGIESIGARDGLLVGFGQAMALIPGCSRSGSTLTVSMLLNLRREDAARFSFLLGIPAIVLSGLLELKELVQQGLTNTAMADLLIGFGVSAVVSYVAIAWLLKFLQTHSTWVFVVYRLIFGVAVVFLSNTALIR